MIAALVILGVNNLILVAVILKLLADFRAERSDYVSAAMTPFNPAGAHKLSPPPAVQTKPREPELRPLGL